MADFYKTFSGNSDYRTHLRVLAGSQSSSSNYTNLSGTCWVEKTSGSGYLTYNSGNSGSVTGSIFFGIIAWAPYDFSSYSSKQIGSGANSVTHDSNGNKTASGSYSASDSAGGNFGSASASYSLGLTRIPEEPGKPGTPSVSSVTPDSATFSWSAADRGHADITDYYLQISTSSSFSSTEFSAAVGTSRTRVVAGLPKNDTLYSRVAAINSDGTGEWSSTRTFSTLPGIPSAPTTPTVSYVSTTQVGVAWSHTSAADSYPTSSQVRQFVNDGVWVDLTPISVSTSVTIWVGENTKRIVQVREINSTGTSAWSSSSAPVFTTPAAPTSVAAAKNASLNIVLTFTRNVAYSEYEHVVEHGVVVGGVTTWDASPLTTLSSGVSTYTHVSPNSGNLHVYRVYAKNTDVGARSSAKVTSNTVQLLVAPNKPTLPALGPKLDKAKDFTPTWVHNPVDTTPQRAYEFGYSTDGGTVWSSTGKITSTVSSKTVAASTYAADAALTIRVRTWGEATTGGSEGTGASPWSDQKTVTFKTRPVVTITSPADSSTYSQAALIVELGYSQAESATFVNATINLYSGVGALLETLVSATRSATLLDTPVDNGESYKLKVTVVDSNGLVSDEVESVFSVVYSLPVAAVATATYLPDSGVGQLDLIIYDPGGSHVEATLVTITRTVGGSTEIVVLEYPVSEVLTILDTTPTIHGTNTYKVTTISADGATASTTVVMMTSENRWAFLSTGEGYSVIVKFGGNLSLSIAPTVDSTLIKTAGRARPVALYGSTGDLIVSGSCVVVTGQGSSADELEAFLKIPQKGCYRDPTGRRLFGQVVGKVDRQNSLMGSFAYTVTETS